MPSPFLAPLLLLVVLANGAPLAASKAFGVRWAQPLDSGRRFVDGRPWFGRAKTWRGVACAIAVATAAAPLVGLRWQIGFAAGTLGMAGDLLSSFLKRRFGRASSAPLVGVDQIPEVLFPLLACMRPLSLSLADVVLGVALFFIGEIMLSRVLYAFDLRDRPY